MSKYCENNLQKNEQIVKKAKISKVAILSNIISMIFIITIPRCLINIIRICCIDFGLTNKRVIGKAGIISGATVDLPVNKIQSATVVKGFWGGIFGYGTVKITTAGGEPIMLSYIAQANNFKNAIMAQIEQYEEDKAKAQAAEMAAAMAAAMKANQ
jgi:uncharacterized membrane protein YdbT with pleckstrin-like domain